MEVEVVLDTLEGVETVVHPHLVTIVHQVVDKVQIETNSMKVH